METDNKNAKVQLGHWNKIEANDSKERIKFEINIPRTVVFTCAVPNERVGEDGSVYYSFDVEENKEAKVLNTSAFSLLRGLKALENTTGSLNGKIAEITKVMIKGKQSFNVKALN